MQAFDIFCCVIDNYGDAGVCWRLARRLASMGHSVRLWIDRIAPLARLVPELDTIRQVQTVQNITVATWAEATRAIPPHHGVAIEAFACTPPAEYVSRLQEQSCLWINLEYLSAEDWVSGCHAMPSLQPNGAQKYFWFPGWTSETGGLLREDGLLARRDAARRTDRAQRLGRLTGQPVASFADATRVILLFCYPDAPLTSLEDALAGLPGTTCLLIPDTQSVPPSSHGNLRVRHVPFVSQALFDELLWCCDLNFVRGEDSLVRAIWAGAPTIWQIYPQKAKAHLVKLDAWLALARLPPAAHRLIQAWNMADGPGVADALRAAVSANGWRAWQYRANDWSTKLAQSPDLAQRLVRFCQEKQ